MAIEYLKQATKTPVSGSAETSERVLHLLDMLEAGGEQTAHLMAIDLDGWTGSILLDDPARTAAIEATPSQLKDDIAYAHEHVRALRRETARGTHRL